MNYMPYMTKLYAHLQHIQPRYYSMMQNLYCVTRWVIYYGPDWDLNLGSLNLLSGSSHPMFSPLTGVNLSVLMVNHINICNGMGEIMIKPERDSNLHGFSAALASNIFGTADQIGFTITVTIHCSMLVFFKYFFLILAINYKI